MDMTIRKAIEFYTKAKCNVLKKEYGEVINTTCFCIIIELNNGVNLFFDMHPEMDYVKEYPEYSYEVPNKNNVFRRFAFEITGDKEPIIPINLSKFEKGNDFCLYTTKETLKERELNEFILANDGINIEKYKANVLSIWDSKDIIMDNFAEMYKQACRELDNECKEMVENGELTQEMADFRYDMRKDEILWAMEEAYES